MSEPLDLERLKEHRAKWGSSIGLTSSDIGALFDEVERLRTELAETKDALDAESNLTKELLTARDGYIGAANVLRTELARRDEQIAAQDQPSPIYGFCVCDHCKGSRAAGTP